MRRVLLYPLWRWRVARWYEWQRHRHYRKQTDMQLCLSGKLRVLSLAAMVLVLYIHAGFRADEIV